MKDKSHEQLIEAFKPFSEHHIVKEVIGGLCEIGPMHPLDKCYADILNEIVQHLIEITQQTKHEDTKINGVSLVDIAHEGLSFFKERVVAEGKDLSHATTRPFSMFQKPNPMCFKRNLTDDLLSSDGKWVEESSGLYYRNASYLFADSRCIAGMVLSEVMGNLPTLTVVAGKFEGNQITFSRERNMGLENSLFAWIDYRDENTLQPHLYGNKSFFEIEASPQKLHHVIAKILTMIKHAEGMNVFGYLEKEIYNFILSAHPEVNVDSFDIHLRDSLVELTVGRIDAYNFIPFLNKHGITEIEKTTTEFRFKIPQNVSVDDLEKGLRALGISVTNRIFPLRAEGNVGYIDYHRNVNDFQSRAASKNFR